MRKSETKAGTAAQCRTAFFEPFRLRKGLGHKMASHKGAKLVLSACKAVEGEQRRELISHTKTQRGPFRALSSAYPTSAGWIRCRTKSGHDAADARWISIACQTKPPSLCLCVRPDAASRRKPPATDRRPFFAPLRLPCRRSGQALRLCVRLFFVHRHQRRGHIFGRVNADHRRRGGQCAHIGDEGVRGGQRDPGSGPG